MSGFALSYTANMFILIIPYDLCLSHAQFCFMIAYIGKVESLVRNYDLGRVLCYDRRSVGQPVLE
jgi:hypothetical protein